ncbi:ATP-grasp fold amidoligase family protein [Shewanella sp. HL-SH5]|uniref:ATP-grasp fold amidoligase family protein n=1 Tax=Shewanella sp. HL-SH5 TaxID=3436241 RepID=UPI003EBB7E11
MKFILRQWYIPNLLIPRSFNEKVLGIKLDPNSIRFSYYADKFAVREYIKSKIGEKYLIPLIYVDDCANAISISKLKPNFILKANHDSGNVYIIKEGQSYDFEKIAKLINESLKIDYGKLYDEPWYSYIKPKVIAEKLLVKSDGTQPEDFKFHVFNSNKVILQVDYERFNDHSRSFYNEGGELLPYSLKYKNKLRPLILEDDSLTEMVCLARTLSEGFNYVRIDFYNVDGDIFFGEMTFAHESGLGRFKIKKHDYEWGRFFETKDVI